MRRAFKNLARGVGNTFGGGVRKILHSPKLLRDGAANAADDETPWEDIPDVLDGSDITHALESVKSP
jgi:hypothetical protein